MVNTIVALKTVARRRRGASCRDAVRFPNHLRPCAYSIARDGNSLKEDRASYEEASLYIIIAIMKLVCVTPDPSNF